MKYSVLPDLLENTMMCMYQCSTRDCEYLHNYKKCSHSTGSTKQMTAVQRRLTLQKIRAPKMLLQPDKGTVIMGCTWLLQNGQFGSLSYLLVIAEGMRI